MSNHHCNHHNCDHGSNDEEIGLQYNLFERIDTENLECLNESVEGSGKTYVESDADEELLFNIPFNGNVKLKGIKILSEDSDSHPSVLRLIVTFSSVTHLTMHFPSNFGAENTKIYYIGLRGEWSQAHRHGVTICTYEARPNLEDHKLKHLDSVSKSIE
ncbi:Thioredoxin family Trp26 [Operophtera brumata]|uniref:Thioredoxin family Trp26 n=1 Tax=Operophtera brumata TaxID=104452 RepID=A0A0L7L430_OPEBR|nr:Thioredoxin family Trp26 [Operophtera brumata]